MAISADCFDALRIAVQRQADRVAALAPLIEQALASAHGPYGAQLLADADRRAGRSTSGLHDPRDLLRLIAHDPALADRFDQTAGATLAPSLSRPNENWASFAGRIVDHLEVVLPAEG